jgi:serine/threonine protein phosphatase 1
MRYAISDIHGCRKTYNALLKLINFTKEDTLYILGDVIDRGSDVSGLVDDIIFMQRHGYNIICLMGNHEEFLFESSKSVHVEMQWIQNGGVETLESYNALSMDVSWVDMIPASHWEFYNKMVKIVELDDYVLVHAGLNFSHEDPVRETSSEDMLWTRPRHDHSQYWGKKIGGRYLVTGHTIQAREEIERSIINNRHTIIDGGCVFTILAPDFGNLCCLNLDTRELYFQENIEGE